MASNHYLVLAVVVFHPPIDAPGGLSFSGRPLHIGRLYLARPTTPEEFADTCWLVEWAHRI